MSYTQSKADRDGLDLKLAATELATAREQLRVAQAMPRGLAQDEAVKTAIGKLALAGRSIDLVVDRHD